MLLVVSLALENSENDVGHASVEFSVRGLGLEAKMVTSSSRRFREQPVFVIFAVALLSVASGCQTGGHQATSTKASSASASRTRTGLGPVKVRYSASEMVDGSRSRIDWEILTDGKDRVRFTVLGGVNADGPAIGTFDVWDGETLLSYAPDGNPKYSRDDHPAQDQRPPTPIVLNPDAKSFKKVCPQARRAGSATLLARSAVRYQCGAPGKKQSSKPAKEVLIDEATGLLLKGEGLVVTELTFDPPISKNTFSTEMPTRAAHNNYQPPADFRLPRVGGGELALADYRRAPLVIVTGDADGIRKMAGRMARIKGGANRPPVIGLLNSVPPANWRGTLLNPADVKSLADSISNEVGPFDIPVGIDFKGNEGSAISGPAGVPEFHTRPAAVGFLQSDGTMTQVLTQHSSDDELQQAVRSLS